MVKAARTAPGYYITDLGHAPAMYYHSDYSGQVEGEVYLFDKKTLQKVDRAEGHPWFYVRSTITLEDGSQCLAYIMTEPRGIWIRGTSWRPVEEKKRNTPEFQRLLSDRKARKAKRNGREKWVKKRPEPQPQTALFVYGTLMSGFGNDDYLKDAMFLGEFFTSSGYFLTSMHGAIPVMHGGGSATDVVLGELYIVTDDQLKAIDAFEGHPDFYKRCSIKLENGLFADAYMMRDFGAPRLECDSWRLHLEPEDLPF